MAIFQKTHVLSSLAVSDGRVATCYGCSLPLKITLPGGGKANPNRPFDLVVIAKQHRQFRKDGKTRVLPEARNVYFHVADNALQPFTCAKSKLNLGERSIKIDAKFRPSLQDIHRGFIQFRLQLDHLLPYLQMYPFQSILQKETVFFIKKNINKNR